MAPPDQGSIPAADAPPPATAPRFPGGGEMGARMRALDWSKTPVGDPSGWPQALGTSLRIMLSSRYPMFIWWGRELTNFYNDAYIPALGQKHPAALGRPAAEIWRDIWGTVGPQAEAVMTLGEASWAEEVLLVMERNGYLEETYFTYSYSPVPDDSGGIGGVFCACTEDTERVLGERRLRSLRQLAAATATARSTVEACELAARSLGENAFDVSFALIYLLDPEGKRARLACSTGIDRDHPRVPAEVDLTAPAAAYPWPFSEGAAGRAAVITGIDTALGLPGGPWPEPTTTAMLLPLGRRGQEQQAGMIIVGASPRRAFDERYKGFFELIADGVANAVANARAYAEERARAETLAELDRAKTTFFSNISHELRTPLTLMLGPIEEEIARRQGDAEGQDRLRIAHRSSLRLLKLVNTLLDFSRIEAGRLQASFEPTDLAAFTAEIASVFRAAMEKAGLRLEVDCPPLPEPVYVDPELWEKIVLNLLSNAFKHTFEGGVSVSLRARGLEVDLTVRDTGTGIPREEQEHVFERFHRVKGARARSHEGTGIGLALVQELTKLHGGRVHLESQVGRGSSFTVSLKRGRDHLPSDRIGGERSLAGTALGATPYIEEALRWLPSAPVPEPSDEAADAKAPEEAGRARILLVDDNADMCAYVQNLLGARWTVETASDGLAALALTQQRVFNLLLTDVMMPGLDGIELLRAVRSDPKTSTMPVIMLSARAGDEARLEGLEAGADDYLVKPFTARELVARVHTQLTMARLRRRAEEVLKEADRRKDEFLTMLAHELRNPLAPIRTSLEILRRSAVSDPAVERARAMIERQVAHMVRLVDDLLDVSRISRGKILLREERLDLAGLVRTTADDHRASLEAAGLSLRIDVPDEPVFALGDPTRLAQAVDNLLQNAGKFTDKGGSVEVRLEVHGPVALIRVTDTGIGMAPDVVPHIFEPFTQADRSLDRSRGGLGLGLALVKGLLDLHGGRVEASSQGLGEGSEIRLLLPIEAAPAPAEPRGPAPPKSDTAKRVLIIEDNVDAAESLSDLLELMGHEVHVEHIGTTGIAAAKERLPDVVLCDIGLPGAMDGYAVARALRAIPDLRAARLIALTGYGGEENRRTALEAGFHVHLTKPFELEALEEILARLPPRAPGLRGG